MLHPMYCAVPRLAKYFQQLILYASSPFSTLQPFQDRGQSRAMCQCVRYLSDEIRTGILIDRDIFNVSRCRAGLLQAILNTLRRKPSPMLHSAEAFLLRCRNELAIADDTSRCVTMVRIDAEHD